MDNDPEPVQEQKKEKPLNELLTSAIVDIYIGPDSTHWPLHERLLCYHSPFFSNIFYNDHDKKSQENGNKSSSGKRKSYGFPDEEDYTFTLLVGWLYSRTVPPPKTEKDVGPLLDLYLLSEKLQIERLSTDVVAATRDFYHTSSSYPGLRRVQYIYANTDEDNEMREMMVSCVARQLATTEKIPAHWATALQRNGQLAVDIIRSIQRWNLEERSIPDIRDSSISSGRGRKGKGGFSAIVREGDSLDTEATTVTGSVSLGSNLGVESITSDDIGHTDDKMSHSVERSVSETGKAIAAEAEYLTLSSLSLLQAQLKRPPDEPQTPQKQTHKQLVPLSPSQPQHQNPQPSKRRPRRSSVTFKDKAEIMPDTTPTRSVLHANTKRDNTTRSPISPSSPEDDQEHTAHTTIRPSPTQTAQHQIFQRKEAIFLAILWIVYLYWFISWTGIWQTKKFEK